LKSNDLTKVKLMLRWATNSKVLNIPDSLVSLVFSIAYNYTKYKAKYRPLTAKEFNILLNAYKIHMSNTVSISSPRNRWIGRAGYRAYKK